MTPGPSPYAVAVAARLRLSTAQSATLKAIEGEPLTRDELRVFRKLTKTMLGKPREGGYQELWVRAGRRSGKSLHLGAPCVVSALLGEYGNVLSVGERGRVTAIAPTLAHLRQLFDGVCGILQALNIEHVRREGEVEPVGRRTILIGTVADAISPRGGTAVLGLIDEAALLGYEPTADSFDQEILAALKPSLATTGGRLIVLSSPWARQGIHHEAITKYLGAVKGDVLAVDSETWVWNESLTEEQTHKLEPNELRWRREYAAKPGDNESSAFSSRDISRAITRGIVERPPMPGIVYGGCGDLAFRHDGAAIGVAHRQVMASGDGPPVTRLVVDVLRVRRPSAGTRLDPEQVIEEWAALLKRFRVRRLWLDSFGFDLASARFKARGIKCELLPMNLAAQQKRYDALGGRLRAGSIDLVDNSIAQRELQDLRVELLPQGQVRYSAPSRASASDDCADVLAGLAGEATQGLRATGGNIECQTAISFDEGGIDIDQKWFTRQALPGGTFATVPCLPPRGTVAYDRAKEERNALGIYTPEDQADMRAEAALNVNMSDE